jgi:hypothetical protein
MTMRSPGKPSSSARFSHHGLRLQGLETSRILIHQSCEQFLIQTAPVHADSNRFLITTGKLHQDGKVLIMLEAASNVTRIDPVLVQRLSTFRIASQQLVPVEMEISYQRHIDPKRYQTITDVGHLAGGFEGVDRDSHELRTCLCQCGNLTRRRRPIRRIGVGHGLHHDGRGPADGHTTHLDLTGMSSRHHFGELIYST